MKKASKEHSPYPETEVIIAHALPRGDILWIFDGEFAPLDNFYETPVLFQGNTFPTVEHAYQWAKVIGTPAGRKYRDAIRTARTPGAAKGLGQKAPMRRDWDVYKFEVMRELLDDKFGRDRTCCELLLSTGNRLIVEGNSWGDDCWGMIEVRPGVLRGHNSLGNMLMDLRTRLREE